MKSEEITSPDTTDPLAEVNEFETKAEREHRVWITSGADAAYQILEFIRGNGRPLSLDQVGMTNLYKQCSSAEKNALRVACADVTRHEPTTREKRLREEREGALLAYACGHKVSGHWREELDAIPVLLANQQRFDAMTFGRRPYQRPKLFQWIFREAK